MIVQRKWIWLFFPLVASLFVASLTIGACGDTPTPKPQPTFALEVSPGMKVQVGQRVAIIAKIEPIEKLSLEWSVSGDAEGKLNTYEGEQIIYIGGKEGTDILVAEGTTASGVSVKQTVILTVVDGLVTRTPTPSPTSPSASPPPTSPSPLPSPTSPFASPLSESRIYCTDGGSGGTETLAVEPPRTVARIRIDLEKRATEHGFSLWEVEAYGPDTGNTNLVTGGEARTSSEQDSSGCIGCFADQAIDGDMTTRWSSDWYDPQWLEITLPAPQVVDRIVLKWETAYARRYCVTVIGLVTPSTPTPTDTPRPAAECPFGASPRLPFEGPPVDMEVEITSPSHCDTGLATIMRAGGTYSGDLTGKEMWILVYPIDARYYPQTLDACQQIPSDASGGNWETIVNFGGPPQQYDVVAVVTDADGEASQEFKRWLKTGCETGDFPGYLRSELPGGITEVDAITVSTEEPTEEPTPESIPPVRGECPFDGIPFRTSIEGPSVDAEVHITSMENCADNLPAATSIPLAGTYSGDLTNKEIWILVYPLDLKYYPQSTDACANISTPFANGQWSEIIRLGREGVPEAFHIVAVVTDIGSPASEAFHNYLTVGCTSGNYQGLILVPPGATELDSITVHTR